MGRPLAESNPHLRDPEKHPRGVFISVATSSAIEGIRAPFAAGMAELSSRRGVSRSPNLAKRATTCMPTVGDGSRASAQAEGSVTSARADEPRPDPATGNASHPPA